MLCVDRANGWRIDTVGKCFEATLDFFGFVCIVVSPRWWDGGEARVDPLMIFVVAGSGSDNWRNLVAATAIGLVLAEHVQDLLSLAGLANFPAVNSPSKRLTKKRPVEWQCA